MALPIHVAIVSESKRHPLAQLTEIAAALNKQVMRDFSPHWNVNATVDAFKADRVPAGYWPIYIKDDINMPGAAGVHLDNNGQPFSLVAATGSNDISITISHELLEMLVDPFGNRLVAGDSINPNVPGRCRYLVEVCDPSEMFAYEINGIKCSDFYFPSYFDPVCNHSCYSFTGALTKPKQILPGGYISYMDDQNRWWQATYWSANLQFEGPFNWSYADDDTANSLRQMIDSRTTARSAEYAATHGYTVAKLM